MKKAMVAIVAAVYAIAIIIVAFLGVQAEIHNATVNVTNILLADVAEAEAGEIYTYYSSNTVQTTATRVYSILVRPTELNDKNQDSEGNTWELNETKFNYIIKIWDFNYVYESTYWKDGATHFNINAYAVPEDSKQELRCTLSNISSDYVTVTNQGILTFEQKLTEVSTFNLTVSSTDTSGVKIYINFVVAPYF